MTEQQIQRVLEGLLEPVSTHVLLHMGYRPEQIATLADPFDHEAHGCEFDTNHMGWICTDENDMPLHPDDDEMGGVVEIVRVALEAPAVAEALAAQVPDISARVRELADGGSLPGHLNVGMYCECGAEINSDLGWLRHSLRALLDRPNGGE